MQSLFALTAQYRELQQLDIEAIDEETLMNTLEGLGGEIELKATNVAKFAKHLQAMAVMAMDASTTLAGRSLKLASKVARLEQYIQSCMEAAQITKIDTAEISLKIKKNPDYVSNVDPNVTLPPRFMRYSLPPIPQPNIAEIKVALKAGEAVEGYRLDHTYRLEIKI